MTGLTAGPERPPVTLPRRGRKVPTSIDIARIVLATTTASAPFATAARATSAISPVFGVSLTQRGNFVAARKRATTPAVACGVMAKARPSSSRLGHEILASIAATPATVISAAKLANPSAVGAEMLATSGGEKRP